MLERTSNLAGLLIHIDPETAIELMITVMLHKMDEEPWSETELDPLRKIEILDVTPV